VNDGNLLSGHSGGDELLLHVLEEIEVATLVTVGKDNNGPAFGFRAAQDIERGAHGGIGFAVGIVWAGWIVKARIERDGAGVGVEFEPVVFRWVRPLWIAHWKAQQLAALGDPLEQWLLGRGHFDEHVFTDSFG